MLLLSVVRMIQTEFNHIATKILNRASFWTFITALLETVEIAVYGLIVRNQPTYFCLDFNLSFHVLTRSRNNRE